MVYVLMAIALSLELLWTDVERAYIICTESRFSFSFGLLNQNVFFE